MNLHAIVTPAISAVNPRVLASLYVSTGFALDANHVQVPAYAAPVTVSAQVQPVSGKDLKQLDSLNVQGVDRVAYLYGDVQGVVRVARQGGSKLAFANTAAIPPSLRGRTWLVTVVLETWDTDNWCKVGLTLQDDPLA